MGLGHKHSPPSSTLSSLCSCCYILFLLCFPFCSFLKKTQVFLKMRPAMSVVSLLFLLLLLAETTQAIRLEVESLALFHKIIHKESFTGKGGAAEVTCKEDEPCSGGIRKLMTKAMPTSKSERSSKQEVGHHSTKEIAKSKRPEDFRVEPPETYPDILDIAGMDYSPAKRKPPIHN